MDRKHHELSDFFTPTVKISTTEQAMYDWIELIVKESLPISITKKKSFHRFKKDRTNFSQEKVKETLYKLVELGESRIRNSEVNCMTKRLLELNQILESVQNTMRQCKQSLRNAAVLRNLSTLKPIMYNKTRWSGKYDVLKRFIKIREDLIKAADDENTTLEVNSTMGFLNKVKRHQKALARIQIATKEMQTQFHSLLSCRADLDLLVEDINMYKTEVGHVLYQCKLGKKYIGSSSEKLHSIFF